ncbi:glycine betaine/L-proline ABC transporter ATP-binding protein [Atlantibacter hermannii]|nr:glycine betaine/L-proline ABC transporter ATP-binding protein [Atlantibacter hermannii]
MKPCELATELRLCKTARWVQIGTPDEILNNPANDYVRTFFRGVDISQVFSAKDIARERRSGLIRKTPGFGPRSAIKLLQDEDRDTATCWNAARNSLALSLPIP